AATTAARLLAARARTPEAVTWAVTAAVALSAGIWAILGAFLGVQSASSWILVVAVVAPTAEEVLKVALPLVVVELRPHLFSSRAQIAIAAASSGLVFAAVENFLYLGVYIAEPSGEIALWRWTVCVALHTGCSLVSGLGVARVWAAVWERLAPPRPDLATSCIALAAAIHGAYNALAAFRVIGPPA
ncbi:MAG: PrsW family glutamic-type intramembrane protease, partial [Planctomycetota bacterium]